LIREVELAADGLLRIPPEIDVPISDRVGRVIDSSPMRRLSEVSQLGLVHLVYPGARHSRLEHSLGVYRNALLFLQTLQPDLRFRQLVDARGAEAFLLASLLHDAGHWPFCHAIEDMRLATVPRHESRVVSILERSEVAKLIAADWYCSAADIQSILSGQPTANSGLPPETVEFLASCISGPVDVDKLDYLVRDSLHAGVPYGRNFDASRLLSSLTVHPEKPRIAITEKGRTAAEMMVFARYVMFSEVYWHHAVRSATAMLQRLFFELQTEIHVASTFDLNEAQWIAMVHDAAVETNVARLADGLFGPRRRLYKRAAEFNVLGRPKLHRQLSHRPYWWLVACGDELARRLSAELGTEILGTDLLIDAPPVKLEVDINMDVVTKTGEVRKLGDVSPVAHSLAHQQFDGHVKRVRIFVREEWRDAVWELMQDDSWLTEAIETVNREVV
jgi:HD superfamily phosphohydrolase